MAYWYFDFNDAIAQTVENCLRSLMRQLGASFNELPPEITQLEKEFRAAGKQPPSARLASALASMISRSTKDIFVVLDALDEYPHQTQNARKRDHSYST